MALAAAYVPLGTETPPVLDIELVFARLPAETRAKVAWAKKPIADALARLRTAPLTDELVAETVDGVIEPFLAFNRAASVAFAPTADAFRVELMQELSDEHNRLASFVATDEARDTLDWIVRMIQSFLALTSVLPAEEYANLSETTLDEAARAPVLMSWWRGLVALMAALDEAKHGDSRERACELLDVAFLELTRFRNTLRRQGAPFHVFPSETTDQRRERRQRYTAHLREVLTKEDLSEIERARMHDLR